MTYVLHLLVIVLVYLMLALSLDLLAEKLGMLSLCHAAFFAIGAYASAIISVKAGGGLLVGMFTGGLLAVGCSQFLAAIAARLRDDYFAIGTFFMQTAVFHVLNNAQDLTNGPFGIARIPAVRIWTLPLGHEVVHAIYASIFACILMFVFLKLEQSAFGRVLRGIRENEALVQSYGKSPAQFKAKAAALSALVAALSGSVYAHFIGFIDPSSFTVMQSISILAIVIIGSSRGVVGMIGGTALFVLVPEILRFTGLPPSVGSSIRQISFGAVLMTIVWLRSSPVREPQVFAGRSGV